MNAVDQLIEKLRNRAGWWEGDDNARTLLEPLIEAQNRLAVSERALETLREQNAQLRKQLEEAVIP